VCVCVGCVAESMRVRGSERERGRVVVSFHVPAVQAVLSSMR
jgi:hypothetical protein